MRSRPPGVLREGFAAATGLGIALILVSSVAFESFGDLLRVVVTGGIFWLVAAVVYLGTRRLLHAWREPN